MSHIGKHTISAAKRPVTAPVFESRRGMLLEHLAEQRAMAEALVAGTTHAAVRRAWRIDEGGNKELIERPKRLRPWFWQDGTGKWRHFDSTGVSVRSKQSHHLVYAERSTSAVHAIAITRIN